MMGRDVLPQAYEGHPVFEPPARFIKELPEHLPAEARRCDPLFRLAETVADGSSINVAHLIQEQTV